MVDLAVHRCNHSRLSALYDTLCAAAGLPRIFCEAFDSGRSGSLAAIKVVESDDVRTADARTTTASGPCWLRGRRGRAALSF